MIAITPIPPHDVRQRSGKAGGERDRLRVRNRETNGRGIGDADARPALDALHRLVVEESDLDGRAPHLEGVRADDGAGDVLLHVRVHALDHRHHGDEERDGHDDAEERKERAQLIGSYFAEGDAQQVGQAHAGSYPPTAIG